MKSQFPDHMELFCKNGCYPYECVNVLSKLNYVGLPPKEALYSTLKKEGPSDEDYHTVVQALTALLCVHFKEYHRVYLKSRCSSIGRRA